MGRIHELIKSLNIIDVITSTQFKVGSAISGGLGTIINLLYGKANLIWIMIFSWIIVLDWITGSKASKLDGTYSSEYGIEGTTRTEVLLSLPALAL
ncbi:phage holin family protein, partial [Paenibacillus sp. GbtcB18]|uniref:phage holin family protein n=1 Tax=Paenibacillus sp. GbtcB18 TaxID=2824763 RepID=UPI0020C6FBB1